MLGESYGLEREGKWYVGGFGEGNEWKEEMV